MKKFILSLVAASMLSVFVPGQIRAESNSAPSNTSSDAAVNSKSDAMTIRLNEIKAMDNSNLNSAEKKELRKEVRAIKSESKSSANSKYIEGSHGGVYVSVGAAIIIILLLILLL